MEETENIFFAESAHIDLSIPKDKLKIGEIFQYNDGKTTLNCIHCSQEFQFFTEFTLHIQEHYFRNEILPLVDNIKTEDGIEGSIDCFRSTTPIFEKSENSIKKELVDVNDDCDNQFNENSAFLDSDSDDENVVDNNFGSELFQRIINNEIKQKEYKEIADKFECMICSAEIKRWDHFKEHCRKHSKLNNRVSCPLCEKRFSNESNVQKHIHRFHKQKVTANEIRALQSRSEEASIPNPLESVSFIKIEDNNENNTLFQALGSDNENEMSDSEVSNPLFQRIINGHIKQNEYKEIFDKFECMVCKVVIKRWDHFKEHCRRHSQRERVFCPLCKKIFSNENNVRKHISLVHKQKISANEIRGAQSVSADSLISHEHFNVPNYQNEPIQVGNESKIKIEQKQSQNANRKVKQFVLNKDYKKVNGKFKCLKCSKFLSEFRYFKEHYMTHGASKNVVCPICSKAFITVGYVQKHIWGTHKQRISRETIKNAQTNAEDFKITFAAEVNTENESKRLQCLFCAKRFGMLYLIQRHIRYAHDKRLGFEEIFAAQQNPELKPEDFTVENNRSQKATKIESDETIEKKFECFQCHRRVNTMKHLRLHMRLHGDKKFGCPLCLRAFSLSSYVKSHLVFKHDYSKEDITNEMITKYVDDLPKSELPKQEMRDYECILCKSHYKSPESLRLHMRIHKSGLNESSSLLCPICGAVFKRSATFRSHMEVHEAGTSRDIKCDDCDKMFPTRRYMLIHKHRTHGTLKHKCNECGKSFSTSHYFNRHIQVHSKSPAVNRCNICGLTFRRAGGLKDHMLVHTNNKTICNVCGKEVTARYLKQHLNIHMGIKEVQCNICDMAFMDQKSLRAHMVRHEDGEMKFKCSKCPKAFRRQNKYLLHLRGLHLELLAFNCSKCDKGFLTLKSLKKHENEHYREENVIPNLLPPNF